ncbi:MAG: aldo/keto reductase [Sphingomonadaceae bacterium]|nr:aldo/keto reductase [Sphingomonadaceae bacterium]
MSKRAFAPTRSKKTKAERPPKQRSLCLSYRRSSVAKNNPSIGGLPLVLGGNVFGWTIDRDKSFEVLDSFYEAGGRMIDSAEIYSAWVPGNKGGESEEIIGEWMENRGIRKDMLIGTKTNAGGQPGGLAHDKVVKALDASLDRLRSDYVDLYYAHRDDPDTPLDEVVATYDEAYRSGKARELAASNYSTDRLAAIIAKAREMGAQPFTVLQPQYNLVERDAYEGQLQDFCVANEIVVLPYFALAAGFLSGKYSSESDWDGHARGAMLKAASDNGGWQTLAVLRDIAAELGTKPAQVAIAWLNTQPGISAPIASATSTEQLADLVEAVSLKLDPSQVERLNNA